MAFAANFAQETIASLCVFSQSVNAVCCAVRYSLKRWISGASAVPMAIAIPSAALKNIRNAPPIPASIVLATRALSPEALSIASMSVWNDSAESFAPPARARISNSSLKIASRSAFGISAVACPTSFKTSAILRRFPSASLTETPSPS